MRTKIQLSSTTAGIFTKESSDTYGAQLAYSADSYGAAVSYANSDTSSTDTVYWGLNAYYSFENTFLDSISAGYETANPSVGKDSQGYFLGLSTTEIGPGSFSFGLGTNNDVNDTTLIVDDADTSMLYEASYGWDVNDGMSILLGGFFQERIDSVGADMVGIAAQTSFSF